MELLHDPETWVAIGFLMVIALLLWKGVPAMVARMLDQRAAIIAAELDEAKKLRAEAAALLLDYQARAAGAEKEAAAIVEAAKADAAQFAKDSRAGLAAQIERRAAAAKDKIAQAEAAALNEIRALAADAAVTGAQKLIAARMDDKRASGLIDASIKGLGGKLN
ncbi:MAG TPA: ATP F0F1 synthase subunit B [Rhizomicrobium sp.]|jgi:F-type H+-transporting ATPase subunit b|nr:ATP F0F1 synthase subunit B [Rhizomicrobium sp.]